MWPHDLNIWDIWDPDLAHGQGMMNLLILTWKKRPPKTTRTKSHERNRKSHQQDVSGMYSFGLPTPHPGCQASHKWRLCLGFFSILKNGIVLVTVTGGGVVPMYKATKYFNCVSGIYWEPIFTLSPRIIDHPGWQEQLSERVVTETPPHRTLNKVGWKVCDETNWK